MTNQLERTRYKLKTVYALKYFINADEEDNKNSLLILPNGFVAVYLDQETVTKLIQDKGSHQYYRFRLMQI